MSESSSSHSMESIDTPETVIASILRGEYDKDILSIIRAAIARRDDITSREVFQKSISFTSGTRVKITSGRPIHMIGSMGTIEKVMQKYCIMRLDKGGTVRCPLSMLEKIT